MIIKVSGRDLDTDKLADADAAILEKAEELRQACETYGRLSYILVEASDKVKEQPDEFHSISFHQVNAKGGLITIDNLEKYKVMLVDSLSTEFENIANAIDNGPEIEENGEDEV